MMTRIGLDAKQMLRLTLLLAATTVNAADRQLDTIVVIGQRTATATGEQSVAIGHIDAGTIQRTAHTHVTEIASRTPGAWISRGSGQEHLTAIRSPVLTGAGSCGAFLFLEDGIPIRPAGFCNVNQLFEVNTEQAESLEIARGPLSAVWGANALHGAVNVVLDRPRPARLTLGTGPDDFFRVGVTAPLPMAGNLLMHLGHDGGFRAASGYDQGKVNVLLGDEAGPRLRFAATRLQQETAGFVVGDDAYRDDALRESNSNPEAFRDADSQRLSIRWSVGAGWNLLAFARHSRMVFLQHFLPGQPLERNGQKSAGFSAQNDFATASPWRISFGIDTELAQGYLEETQARPATGSAFLRATRPVGRHYDYEADSLMLGVWVNTTRPLSRSIRLDLAGRVESLRYRYDNAMSTGNLREDGSVCGFGGCLFNRPADRSDTFTNLAPRVALVGKISERISWWSQVSQGFRPPQATELYRLQNDQASADLDNEKVTGAEAGLRLLGPELSLELAVFWMRKTHFIFRDAEGFNVSDGQTRHQGLEAAVRWRPLDALTLELDATNALHRYAFDRNAAQGETIADGARVDTAPRHLASARLRWRSSLQSELELEWLYTGTYFMDAANSRKYPGHDLLNLRYTYAVGNNWSVQARLTNLADSRYAERADFAFGNPRYFPGRERSLFFELAWQPAAH